MPDVSVVIPTTGRPSLRTAVAAAANQTVPTQVIVVLARPMVEDTVREQLRDLPYELVVPARDLGASAARNAGVDHARAEYLAFCDDDDWWVPHKLERQLEAIAAGGTDRRIVLSGLYFHRRSGTTRVLPRRLPRPGESIGDYATVRSRFWFGESVVQSSTLFAKAELFRRVPWDVALAAHQDWDLVIRLSVDHGVAVTYVPEPLVHVVQGSTDSLSQGHDWETSAQWLARHSSNLSRRSRGDFGSVMILRHALRSRDVRGIATGIRSILANPPHLAALAVGLTGIRRRR